jgi:hypothetical protein
MTSAPAEEGLRAPGVKPWVGELYFSSNGRISAILALPL